MIIAPPSCPQTPADLRIALFSGNYHDVRDGANQALNRLVDDLLRQGAAVRVYSPTIEVPAFEPVGDLVSLPSIPVPARGEYRMATRLPAHIRADLAGFAPNVVHVSSPDIVAHRAVTWARGRGLPVLASVHTRFETYLRYYRLGWLEPAMLAMLRRFYQRCDALVAPSETFVDVLLQQGMNADISLWSRGIDHALFNPQRRDAAWRRSLGIGDDVMVIGFLGRLVLEKGLDVFTDTIAALAAQGVPHKVLVIGEGPAREWFAQRLPGGVFTGYLADEELARAVASMDVLFNPSVTEAFGNVTQEAMACGLPVVAAAATGSKNLVSDGVNGRLIAPGEIPAFADALRAYVEQPELRSRHGAAGLERARDRSWDRINHAVVESYLRLTRRKAGLA